MLSRSLCFATSRLCSRALSSGKSADIALQLDPPADISLPVDSATVSSLPVDTAVSSLPVDTAVSSLPVDTAVSSLPVSTLSGGSPLGPVPIDGAAGAVSCLPAGAWYDAVSHYQHLLDAVQVGTGAPWWAVLCGTGVLLRTSLIACNVAFDKRYLRTVPFIRPQNKIIKELRVAQSRGDSVMVMVKNKELKWFRQENKMTWKHNPMMALIPNFAVLLLNFTAVRGLGTMPYQPFLDCSLLWLPNLSATDPMYILPVLNSVLIGYNLKKGVDTGNSAASNMFSNPFVLGGLVGVTIFTQSYFSSGLVLYWLASNITGTLVVMPLMQNDRFRAAVGLKSMAERNELMALVPTMEEQLQKGQESYQKAREEGYEREQERRAERLRELEEREERKKAMEDERAERDEAQFRELKDELKRKEEELLSVKQQLKESIEREEGKLESAKK